MDENAPSDLGRAGSDGRRYVGEPGTEMLFRFPSGAVDILGERRSGATLRSGRIGPITMGDITCGHLESRHRGLDVVATQERAALYPADGEIIRAAGPLTAGGCA